MPLNLSDSELDCLIKNRLLLKKFVVAAANANFDINNDIDPGLTIKEKIVYDLIMDDLNAIHNMLAEVCVEENANRDEATHAPYQLEWSEYELSHVATITKSNSDFFWTVSASKESGNEFRHLLNTMPTLKIERKSLVCIMS